MSSQIRRAAAALAVAALALVLSACGGSSDGTTEPATGAPTAGSTSAATITNVDVSATEYAYTLSTTDIPAGTVNFTMKNDGAMEHNLVLDGGPGGTSDVIKPGETTTLTVTLEPGTYTLYCSLPGHRAKGMEIQITVS